MFLRLKETGLSTSKKDLSDSKSPTKKGSFKNSFLSSTQAGIFKLFLTQSSSTSAAIYALSLFFFMFGKGQLVLILIFLSLLA